MKLSNQFHNTWVPDKIGGMKGQLNKSVRGPSHSRGEVLSLCNDLVSVQSLETHKRTGRPIGLCAHGLKESDWLLNSSVFDCSCRAV